MDTRPRTEDIDGWIGAGTAALGIRIDPAWRAEIRRQVETNLLHGARVTAFRLDDEAEPAPVFEA